MKRCFAIVVLFVFLITYLLPVATLVKADVVIGDSNEVIVNENAYILGRKLALLESVPDLLNSGVTELTISNTEDVDAYLDYLWGEINDALDYVTSGDGLTELSNDIRNDYLINLNNYLSYIDNRAHILAETLDSPTTTFLKTYLLGKTLGKKEYIPHTPTLNTFKTLSYLNGESDNPDANVPSDYVVFVNQLINAYVNNFDLNSSPLERGNNYHLNFTFTRPVSWICQNPTSATDWADKMVKPVIKTSIHITTNQNGTCSWTSSLTDAGYIQRVSNSNNSVVDSKPWGYLYTGYYPDLWFSYSNSTFNNPSIYNFDSLTLCFNYLVQHFKYVDVYVDGVVWGLTSVVPNPTMDIDGFLTIYGNDNPPKYDIVDGTKLDYDLLYQTIYNAIQDNLPISQQDINYYDSHDTIYSPTIINNYGNDPDGETDWIESILDYAIVPEFDTALVEPISEPITNGTLIMVTGVSVIPEDILFVLGAAFVLILFACIINRMIE